MKKEIYLRMNMVCFRKWQKNNAIWGEALSFHLLFNKMLGGGFVKTSLVNVLTS
jgi:hypothetical protein